MGTQESRNRSALVSREFPGKVKHYFDQTDRWLVNNPTIPIRCRIVDDLVRCFLRNGNGLRILDVGCGDARVSLPFLDACAALTLVDISQMMLDAARARVPLPLLGKVRFVEGDFLEVLPPEKWDLVICLGVMAHATSVAAAIRLLATSLTRSGILILQFTDAGHPVAWTYARIQTLMRRFHPPPARGYTTNRTTLSQILACANDGGLRVVARKRYFDNFVFVSRLPQRVQLGLFEFTYKSPLLQFMGSENIVAFAGS